MALSYNVRVSLSLALKSKADSMHIFGESKAYSLGESDRVAAQISLHSIE